MSLELTGKVVKLLDIRTGEGRNGAWKKQEFVVETEGQYPKRVCFSLWGEKIDKYNIAQDDQVNVSFDLESREYNERWYTDARAWKVTKGEDINVAPPPEEEPPHSESNEEPTDDLPF